MSVDLSAVRPAGPVRVSVRSAEGSEDELEWASLGVNELRASAPWRTFRWHHGQQHFPGSYWATTMSDLVIYESRLELARLLFADFDRRVSWIAAQPFLLTAWIDGRVRRHVPDFLFVTDSGHVVVDVKPRRRLENEKVAFTLAWSRAAVEDRGWRYEVWSEPPEAELANVRFLAGYRRDWLFDQELLAALTSADLVGSTFGEAVAAVSGWPLRLVRAHLLHLLWKQAYTVDLASVLSDSHILGRAA